MVHYVFTYGDPPFPLSVNVMIDLNKEKKGEITMVIIASLTFPPESAKDVGKRFTELPPLPDYIKMVGPYIRGSGSQGIQVLAPYEMDASKVADAMIVLGNRYVAYFGVPGFKYSINVWYDITEALAMVGLA
ncbi:MAG: hypothetical protein JRC86_01035 [Deltaproteobacteria bacterium]|nr:hypothetical protein [Deltaproteobacteria bacterium]